MKKHIRNILLVLFLVLFAVGTYVTVNMPVKVDVYETSLQTAELFFTEKGVVENSSEVNVYPIVSGKVLELLVEKNQSVEAGQAICKIDTTDIFFDIQQQQAQLKSLEAQKRNVDTEEQVQRDSLITNKNVLQKELEALDVQENSSSQSKEEQLRLQNILIAQTEKDIARGRKDVEKTQQLYQSGVVSLQELEDSQNSLSQLETLLEQNRQQLTLIEAGSNGQSTSQYYEAMKSSMNEQILGIDKALGKNNSKAMKEYYDAQIESTRIYIDKMGQMMEDASIVSPVSGTIVDLPIESTNVATVGMPVAKIASGENLVTVYVATKNMKDIEKGKEVELILKRRENDESYKGVVVKVEEEAEIKISSLGVEERKVKVHVQPQERAEFFKKGYDADVKFVLYQEAHALVVPKTAVFKEENLYKVWQVKNGRLEKVAVEKGLELRSDFVITDGLEAGAIIVKDSSLEELKQGVKVTYEG